MKNSRIKYVRHGFYGTRQYNIWSGMKKRCYNKNEKTYQYYGKKGIVMCDEWKNAFIHFWFDMQDTYFDTATIDRIDNSKGYYKENCRWATRKEQANNKSSVIIYEFNGKKMNSSDWDKELGLKKGTVRARLNNFGWSIEKALSTPKKKYKGYCKTNRGYQVEIKYKGKRYFVGRYKTVKEAKERRKQFLYDLLIK